MEYIGKKLLNLEEIRQDLVMVKLPKCMVPGCTHKDTERIIKIAGSEWHRYAIQGKHVQDVWPDKTPDERELFISGTHPDCWKRAFGCGG